MRRIPEPELMDEPEQARSYAAADFSEPHQGFIDCFRQHFPALPVDAQVLDLGCGPADISMRFARAFPDCTIHGVDGAAAMLAEGHRLLQENGLQSRIKLFQVRLPQDPAPLPGYDVMISNSLLHHLHQPHVMWQTIKKYAKPGAALLVMDLQRPASQNRARQLVEQYAADEPAILQHDFYHSLCAAFTPEEVQRQLQEAGLDYLTVENHTDRHLIIYGKLHS